VELLKQTRQFRQIGKPDWEIENILNKSLDDTWNAEHPGANPDAGNRPPRITVDIIRSYLQRTDAEAAQQGQADLSAKMHMGENIPLDAAK